MCGTEAGGKAEAEGGDSGCEGGGQDVDAAEKLRHHPQLRAGRQTQR